jgi:hypothetical protein
VADRYLLESSAIDGYQLEDGSGVLSLENSAGGGVIKDEARILRWPQEGDFLGGAVPVAPDDDSGGWFGSLPHRVAALALSAAAILLQGSLAAAAIHQQTEEIVPQPSLAVDEDWVAPTPAWPKPILWAPPDDPQALPQPEALVVEEDWQPLPPVLEPLRRLPAWDTDTWLPSIAAEPDDWRPPTVLPSAPTLRLWLDQDERPTPPAGFAIEDDPPSFFRPRDEITGIFWVLQDEITITPPSVGGGILKDPATILRWPQGDDLVTQPTFVPDEDYDWPHSYPLARLHVFSVAVDEDFAPTTFVTEDEPWLAAPAAQSWVSSIEAIDEDWVPAPFVEESDWQPFIPIAVPAAARIWIDQDEVTQALPFDEEAWQPPIPAWTTPILRTWEEGDLALSQPTPLPFDDGDHWQQPWQAQPIATMPPWQVFSDQDEVPTFVPPPAAVETHGDGPRKRGGFAVDQLVVLDLPTATAPRRIFRAPTVRIEATQVQEPLPLLAEVVPLPRITELLAVFPPPPAPSIVRVPDLRIKRVLDHRAVSYGEALNLVERLVSGEVLTLEQRRTLMRFIRSMRIT